MQNQKRSFLKQYATLFLCAAFLLLGTACSRQSSKNTSANSRGYEQASSGKRSKNRFDANTTRHKPKSARQLRKEAKMKSKPQYTDPMYFGHKKPPKKRPRGKQKYCKVCGIWH